MVSENASQICCFTDYEGEAKIGKMTSYSYTQQFLFSEKIAQPSSSVGQEMLNLCTSFLSSISPIAVLSKHLMVIVPGLEVGCRYIWSTKGIDSKLICKRPMCILLSMCVSLIWIIYVIIVEPETEHAE